MLYANNVWKFKQYLVCLQLPVPFIDCTAGTIEKDLTLAAANGHLSSYVEINGTILLFADNNSSPKVRCFLNQGVDIATLFKLRMLHSVESWSMIFCER
jgi:hypothetical protein